MVRVVINSDDFGYSPDVNKATLMAFDKGYISSTTMLANFEEGFEDAREKINNNLIDTKAVGIHLNLTEGTPLTEGIKSCSRFCDGKLFHGKARQSQIFKLAADERNAVKEELNAQIEKIKTLGFTPSHIDSHHHVHTEWAIMNIIKQLAPQHNISKIRLSRNTGAGIGKVKAIYKYLFNKLILSGGFRSTNLMGDINDYIRSGLPGNTDAEIMVHAILVNGDLVDLDGQLLQGKLNLLQLSAVQLINYTEL